MKTKKSTITYLKVVTILLGLLFLLGIGTLVFENHESYKQSRQQEKAHVEALKWLLFDMQNFYDKLRENAFWYNKNYAILSVNPTRDTILDSKHTMASLSKAHHRIMQTITFLRKDIFLDSRFGAGQIPGLLPINYESQQLLGTLRLRDELMTTIDVADEAFAELVYHTELTDSVPRYPSFKNPKFSWYLKNMERLDKLYYDLLSYRYPQGLAYITEMDQKFLKQAKERIFSRQSGQLHAVHQYFKNGDDYGLPYEGNQCKLSMSDSLTTYTIHRNGSKNMLMVQTDADLKDWSLEQQQLFLQEILACSKVNFEVSDANFYLLIRMGLHQFLTKDSAGTLVQFTKDNDGAIMSFYDDESERYYITGGYDAFSVFYPVENQSK